LTSKNRTTAFFGGAIFLCWRVFFLIPHCLRAHQHGGVADPGMGTMVMKAPLATQALAVV
jgi:hypothetical protein